MIKQEVIEDINRKASIVDVVKDFVQLKPAGKELTAPCPLHGGQALRHFMVSPAKNRYYCHVCSEGGGPIKFLETVANLSYSDAIRWLGQKYGVEVDEEQKSERFAKVVKDAPRNIEEYKPEELPMLVLPQWMIQQTQDLSDDIFANWVRSLPWDAEQRGRVEKVLRAYLVGHEKHGATIWWQVDELGQVRDGKIMHYLPNGHRDKVKSPHPSWIHTRLGNARHIGYRQYYDPEKQQYKQCLFGSHLIAASNVVTDTVNIVESEKTAVLMAIAVGSAHGIWLATGGIAQFNPQLLKPLMDLDLWITFFPDKDGVEKWVNVARMINYPKILYNNTYVEAYWTEADGEKADAADVMIRLMLEQRAKKTQRVDEVVQELAKTNPALQQLIDTFDLISVKNDEPEQQQPEGKIRRTGQVRRYKYQGQS